MQRPILTPITLGTPEDERNLLVRFTFHPAISPTFYSPGRDPHISIEAVIDEATADPAVLSPSDLRALELILLQRHRHNLSV